MRPKPELRKKYTQLYKQDPLMANLFLLLVEIADRKGRVVTSEEELSRLMAARFENPREYAL
jgi:hypothetical protein